MRLDVFLPCNSCSGLVVHLGGRLVRIEEVMSMATHLFESRPELRSSAGGSAVGQVEDYSRELGYGTWGSIDDERVTYTPQCSPRWGHPRQRQ